MVGAPTAFQEFWQLYVLGYGAPVLQMLLWIVQIVVFVYALILLKRLVDFKTGRTVAGESDAAAGVGSGAEEKVDIEEFVE